MRQAKNRRSFLVEDKEQEAKDGRATVRTITDSLKSQGRACSKCSNKWCLNSAWFKRVEE
jgi:hypothetical protein